MSSSETLRVRRQRDGRWRWWWCDPFADRELQSNESYPTAEEACDAAREAFPDLAVEVLDHPHPHPHRRQVRTGISLTFKAIGLLLLRRLLRRKA